MTDTLADVVCGKVIWIFGMYYAPETTGSAPYTTDLAEALARAGADVHVIATHAHYPEWKRSRSANIGWHTDNINNVHVHRVPCFIPRAPTLAMRMIYELTYFAASFVTRRKPKPDLVIGTTPNVFSAVRARLAAGKAQVPLIDIVQDVVSQAAIQTGQNVNGWNPTAVLQRIERFGLGGSRAVVIPTDAFRPALVGLGVPEEDLVTIRNWSRYIPAPHGQYARVSRAAGGKFVVLHTGNMGAKQGLEELAPFLSRAAWEEPDLEFRFMGAGNARATLERVTMDLPNVAILEPVPNESYLQELQAADALLVHERSTVHDMSLPSKLTSYFASGRPVIAVTNPVGATADEIRASGAGVVVPHGDSEQLLRTIRELRDDPARAEELGCHGLAYRLDVLSTDAAMARFANVIALALADGPA